LTHKDIKDRFSFDPTIRESYNFWFEENVRFNDLDVMGHVNNVKYNEYFAGARTKLFFEAIPDWPRANIVPFTRTASVDYQQETFYPSRLDIGLRISKFGRTSFEIICGMFVGDDFKAVNTNTFVFVNKTTREATPIPDTAKQNLINATKMDLTDHA
jgi:acyl-CoA thioester hydrolase